MALDRLTKANQFSKAGLPIRVTAPWFNYLVDALNSLEEDGFGVSDGVIETKYDGQMTELPLIAPPSLVYIFFDDFDRSVAAAAPELFWTNTKVGTGTSLTIDGVGGILQMTCQATTDDSTELNYSLNECFRLVAGSKLWFEARVRCPAADVTNLDLFIGLAGNEDITAVADNMPANGMGFTKTDAGVGTIFFASCDNGVNIVTAASIHTLVTNTWTRLGFIFDGGATGAARIYPYINGVAAQPISAVTYATMTEIAPMLMVRNGDATTQQILDVDYVYVAQER